MIVFDLDGTLRNNFGSLEFVPEDVTVNTNWNEWQRWVNVNGTPVIPVVKLYESVHLDSIIVTMSRFGTDNWLGSNDISRPGQGMIERMNDDNRSPFEYKKEFIDFNSDDITLWVDDSQEVCDYAESVGIPVVRVQYAKEG